MKTLTNRSYILPLFLCVSILLAGAVTGFAQQQSDYEVQQDFKQQYKSIDQQLERVQSSAKADSLIEEIKSLDSSYSTHSDLLDKVLYPETYEQEMEELKQQAVSVREKLVIIENQEQELQELNTRLASYDSSMKILTDRTDSLRNAISKSVQSEKELAAMTRRYRRSLEQRDELILSFVDSILIAYRQLDTGSLQEIENAPKASQLNTGRDALDMIQTITDANLEFLSSNPDLTTGDYLRMNNVQQQVSEMWSKVGERLVDIYGENNKEETLTKTSQAISSWGNKIETQTWSSLNRAFSAEGISLPKFTSREMFYNTLNSYLSESIKASEKNTAKTEQKQYQQFSNFWTNRIKAEWSTFMTEGDILSGKQMASIDQQLDQWAMHAEPESNLLVYLFGASVLAIVVLGIMLAREKTSNSKSTT